MHCEKRISVSNIPEISAIYYALLQCGYDFYTIERTAEQIQKIKTFCSPNRAVPFFFEAKQRTCEVYPYWPRAAMLESATFYLNPDKTKFTDFDSFYNLVMSAGNISDIERNPLLWNWIREFPQALHAVMGSGPFERYLEWENQWIKMQNEQHSEDIVLVEACLDFCMEAYHSPVRQIQIVLSPIKCVYSCDYHWVDDGFTFTSGAFQVESVIHEFLHHLVHPVVKRHEGNILEQKRMYHDIDSSYYLTGNKNGQLNAFEEFAVRSLTKAFIGGTQPNDLDAYIVELNQKD